MVCDNGGACNGNHCLCPAGYEGARCEVKTRDRFLGNYTAMRSDTSVRMAPYPTSIEAGATVTEVLLRNFNGSGGSAVRAVVDGKKLDIPYQDWEGRVLVGKGFYVAEAGKRVILMFYKIADRSGGAVEDYGYDTSDPSLAARWE